MKTTEYVTYLVPIGIGSLTAEVKRQMSHRRPTNHQVANNKIIDFVFGILPAQQLNYAKASYLHGTRNSVHSHHVIGRDFVIY